MKLIIGIDPDLDKSGVAEWWEDKTLKLSCLTFPALLAFLDQHKANIQKVVIEASWLIKHSNWHSRQNAAIASETARRVGENHATGKLLECCARAMGLEVQLLKPVATKKNAEQFKRITGYQGSTNPEKRDAGMLVHGMPFKNIGGKSA